MVTPPDASAATTATTHSGRTVSEKAASTLSNSRIAALDGLRGIAILLVLAFHIQLYAKLYFGLHHPVLKVASFGWCGVDLFFVLSGFLITGILYDSRHSEHYFRNFYARRILRIFPLYYGALLIVALLAFIIVPEIRWKTQSLIWQALFLTNFVVAIQGWSAVGTAMAHFWSLAIEEHFYFVWPFLVRWGTRRQLIVAAATLALIAFALRVTFVLTDALWGDIDAVPPKGLDPLAIALYVSTPTRMDALAIGGLCGLLVRGPGGPASVARPALITMLVCGCGVFLIILTRWSLKEYDPLMLTVGLTLLALTFGGAIVAGITWAPLRSILGSAILQWFGRYSYGLYVWHLITIYVLFQPVVREKFANIDGRADAILYIIFTLTVIIAISVASYHFWEKPFLALKKHFDFDLDDKEQVRRYGDARDRAVASK